MSASAGVIDPESAQVALDRAMAVGLMGYPPVLGKRVTVTTPASCVSSPTPRPDAFVGHVETVGPLGFVIVNIELAVILDDGTLHTNSLPGRAFFPWSSVIMWNDAAPPEEPTL